MTKISPKHRVLEHMENARDWLDRAEEGYQSGENLQGELNLNLAQAELKKAWEESRKLQNHAQVIPFPTSATAQIRVEQVGTDCGSVKKGYFTAPVQHRFGLVAAVVLLLLVNLGPLLTPQLGVTQGVFTSVDSTVINPNNQVQLQAAIEPTQVREMDGEQNEVTNHVTGQPRNTSRTIPAESVIYARSTGLLSELGGEGAGSQSSGSTGQTMTRVESSSALASVGSLNSTTPTAKGKATTVEAKSSTAKPKAATATTKTTNVVFSELTGKASSAASSDQTGKVKTTSVGSMSAQADYSTTTLAQKTSMTVSKQDGLAQVAAGDGVAVTGGSQLKPVARLSMAEEGSAVKRTANSDISLEYSTEKDRVVSTLAKEVNTNARTLQTTNMTLSNQPALATGQTAAIERSRDKFLTSTSTAVTSNANKNSSNRKVGVSVSYDLETLVNLAKETLYSNTR